MHPVRHLFPSILSGVLSGRFSDILSGMSLGPCLPSLMPGAGRSHASTHRRRWCRPDRATRREPESACLLRRMWHLGRFLMAGNSGLKSTLWESFDGFDGIVDGIFDKMNKTCDRLLAAWGRESLPICRKNGPYMIMGSYIDHMGIRNGKLAWGIRFILVVADLEDR